MSHLSLLERYNTLLNEEIHASDAITDEKSLITLIKGKRDVGYFTITKRFIKIIEKYKLNIIPVRMTGVNEMKAIVYRNKEKALKLYQIAQSHGGYLADKTAEEAREIGELLGYFTSDVDEYIRRKYGKKISSIIDPSPDDYDDLSEQIKKDKKVKRIVELLKKVSSYLVFHWLLL